MDDIYLDAQDYFNRVYSKASSELG